jgi:hypothetical protein
MYDLRIDRARRELKVRSSIISLEIEEDISNGVYNQFPKLSSRLNKLRVKLLIVNNCLTDSDLMCLIENDYLKQVNY